MEEAVVIEKINSLLPNISDDHFDIKRMYRETVDNLTKYRLGKELSARYLGI